MGRFGDWFFGREGPVTRAVRAGGAARGHEHEPLQQPDPGVLAGNLRRPWYGTPQLADRVWVANRCQQLNAQQIASMPLRFHGPPAEDTEPAWVSYAGPELVPERDRRRLARDRRPAVRVGVLLPVRHRLLRDRVPADVDGAAVRERCRSSSRTAPVQYKLGEDDLNPASVVQIDRNPGAGRCMAPRRCRAYAQQAWGLLAAGNQSLAVSDGGIPRAILKP